MSIQWMLAAGFLYAEMALVLLFITPVFSPKRYNDLFKSNFMKALSYQAQWYFAIIMIILGMLFLDAIREMHKYSNIEHSDLTNISSEMQHNMRLFRAQRNFYISGFALFLSLVIRQLIKLISKQATLMAENEAVLKQAKSATAAARSMLPSGSGETAQNVSNENHQKEIEKRNKEIEELKTELTKSKKDKEAVISQSKAVETEYDRLQEEHRKLQLKLKVSGGEETKKDD